MRIGWSDVIGTEKSFATGALFSEFDSAGRYLVVKVA